MCIALACPAVVLIQEQLPFANCETPLELPGSRTQHSSRPLAGPELAAKAGGRRARSSKDAVLDAETLQEDLAALIKVLLTCFFTNSGGP